MIDLQMEQPVTLAKSTRFSQLRRDGRSPHVSQVYRWASKGLKGHVLETVVIAGSRCTTSEAVDRWIAVLTASANGEQLPSRTPLRRQKEHQRANQNLEKSGW
jgi:hypothetical protein